MKYFLVLILISLVTLAVYLIFSTSPSEKQQKSENFMKGYVLVTFQENTSYKTAKEFMSNLGYKIENTNSYWAAENFTPNDSTVLKAIDIFEVKVGEGNENEVIDTLNKPEYNDVIRNATKNYIMTPN